MIGAVLPPIAIKIPFVWGFSGVPVQVVICTKLCEYSPGPEVTPMQTFSGNPINAPQATGEGVVINSGHLSGHEATATLPGNSAFSIPADAQAPVDNLSRNIVAQIKVTSIDVTENDARQRT